MPNLRAGWARDRREKPVRPDFNEVDSGYGQAGWTEGQTGGFGTFLFIPGISPAGPSTSG